MANSLSPGHDIGRGLVKAIFAFFPEARVKVDNNRPNLRWGRGSMALGAATC